MKQPLDAFYVIFQVLQNAVLIIPGIGRRAQPQTQFKLQFSSFLVWAVWPQKIGSVYRHRHRRLKEVSCVVERESTVMSFLQETFSFVGPSQRSLADGMPSLAAISETTCTHSIIYHAVPYPRVRAVRAQTPNRGKHRTSHVVKSYILQVVALQRPIAKL